MSAKIPINKAVWHAEGLPEGLSLKSGVLSGTPTAAGEHEVTVNVETNWGTGTGSLSICVLSNLGTYEIRQNGSKLEDVTIPALIQSVRNGTAQKKYNTTDTQLILPVCKPDSLLDEEEYRYEYPMNFCSFRDVTLEDGSVRPGLILQGGCSIYTLPFDTKEPQNPDKDRAAYGNNRWLHSNIRQWMNGRGRDWYTPAHEYDEPLPSVLPYPLLGLLDCFPGDFSQLLRPVRIQTCAPAADGGGIDVTYDRFFLASLEESCAVVVENPTDDEWMRDIDPAMAADSGVEGTAWEYWAGKADGEPQYYIDGMDDFMWEELRELPEWRAVGKCASLTRSANLLETDRVWNFEASAAIVYSSAKNRCGIAPACVLC